MMRVKNFINTLATIAVINITIVRVSAFDKKDSKRIVVRNLLSTVSTARSWDQIYQNYRIGKDYDDGAIADGFSESITMLLSDKWDRVYEIQKLISVDKQFKKFILKHIDETIPLERVKKIDHNAGRLIPAGMKSFCREIERRANDVEKNIANNGY